MSTTFTGMLNTGKYRNKKSCSVERCFIIDNVTKKNDTHINKAEIIHNKFMNSNHRHRTIYVNNNIVNNRPTVSNIFNFYFRTAYNRSGGIARSGIARSEDSLSNFNNLICKRLS